MLHFFVILVLSFLIQEEKKRKELYHITKKWNNKIEKHVDANHYVLLAKIFDKKMNSPLKVVLERQPTKKKNLMV